MLPLPSLPEQRVLVSSLAPERLRGFRRFTGGGDRVAIELYLLDAEIASQLHATLRGVEILLRESMHRALTGTYGDHWYDTQAHQLDKRSRDEIRAALRNLGRRPPPGKVVAQLMLGTWVNLLDAGGPLTSSPTSPEADYDTHLWQPALAAAFTRRTALTRHDVHALAQTLKWARNRINHCEPVIFGFPQPGQGTAGNQARKTPERVLRDARELVSMLDPDVGTWMSRWNHIDRLVRDPLVQRVLASPPPGITVVR